MTERMKFCVFFSFPVFLSVAQASTSDTFAIVTSWSGFVFVHDGTAEQLVALIRTESKVSPLPFRPETPVPHTHMQQHTLSANMCCTPISSGWAERELHMCALLAGRVQ